jgi:hypothetical protein
MPGGLLMLLISENNIIKKCRKRGVEVSIKYFDTVETTLLSTQ